MTEASHTIGRFFLKCEVVFLFLKEGEVGWEECLCSWLEFKVNKGFTIIIVYKNLDLGLECDGT